MQRQSFSSPAVSKRSAWTRLPSEPASARPPSTAGGRPKRRLPSRRSTTSGRPHVQLPGRRARCAGDLLSLLRPWVRLVRKRPYGRVIAALITEAQTDPAFAELYRERFVEPRRDQARPILRHAIERGELPATTDVELAVDLLYGPLYHRLLHGHAPLSERFLVRLVDTVLAGLSSEPV